MPHTIESFLKHPIIRHAPEWIVASFVLLGLGWCALGGLSLAYLAYQVPITAQDIADASWLGNPTTIFHFTTGFMAWAMIGTLGVTSVGVSLAKGTFIPAIIGVGIIVPLLLLGTEPMALRIGVLEGTAKIGCYVPNTKECRDMLRLDSKGYRSMYSDIETRNAGDVYEGGYAAEREKIAKSISATSRVLSSMFPAGWVLLAPLHMTDATTLTSLLDTQRAELTALRK